MGIRYTRLQPRSFGGSHALIFLGTPEFAVPTLDAHRRRRPPRVSGGHAARPPQRPQTGTDPVPGQSRRAAPRDPGLPARTHPPTRSRRASARTRARSDGGSRLRPDHPAKHHRYRAARHHQRPRVAAARTARRRAHPVVDRPRLQTHRRHHHAHRRRASIPATSCCAGKPPIGPDETAPELSARLAAAGADLLVRTLAELCAGAIQPEPQDNSLATYAPILKKEDGRIDWSNPAQQIHDLIRGFQPWPGAHTSFRGQSLHLWRSRLVPEQHWNLPPGALVIENKASSPLPATAPLSNYWKYNSKAVKRCRRKFSPTATDLTTDRPTWSMRPFDLPLDINMPPLTLAFANRKRTTLP